jgi:hypothetical protein
MLRSLADARPGSAAFPCAATPASGGSTLRGYFDPRGGAEETGVQPRLQQQSTTSDGSSPTERLGDCRYERGATLRNPANNARS